MPSPDSREFWVIFDSCTRPEYYQDVHNLLALPKGAVMRYEYRDKYLSERALRLALDQQAAPARVLLVYGQRPGFTRGAGNTEANAPAKELHWVCTRFGTMLAIPSTNGANFFFDFSVGGYPKSDPEALRKILAPLITKSETPFNKWVAISDDLSSYSNLDRGDEEANWEAIIDQISAGSMQFKDDSFWRLKPNNSTAKPTLVTDADTFGNGRDVRQISSRYTLLPDDVCAFEAISYSPSGRPATQPSRALRIHVDPHGPLVLDGSASIDLRQYTARILKFRARSSQAETLVTSTVKFETASDQNDWPDGPNLDLIFEISQQRSDTKPPKELKSAETAGAPTVLTPVEQPGSAKTAAEPEAKLPASSTQPEPPKPQPVVSSTPEKLSPWFVLQAAMRAVPAVKYALGVAGLASAAAIARGFFQSPGSALVGTAAVFVLAVLLFAFSSLTQAVKILVWPGLVLTWALTLLFIGSLGLTISTVFFAYPLSYPKLVHQFQPPKIENIRITVTDQATKSSIAGATVTLQNSENRLNGFTNAEGGVHFEVVAGDGSLHAITTAAGYKDSSLDIGTAASGSTTDYGIQLTRLPALPTPAPAPRRPSTKGEKPTAPVPTPPIKIAAAPNVNGTWQVMGGGDINNLRLRDGTFQFIAQNNGEILVTANFVLDDSRVNLSGTATTVGSQVFLKFDAKDAGGVWPGRGDFSIETSTEMSGSIQSKTSVSVPAPVTLRKIPQ